MRVIGLLGVLLALLLVMLLARRSMNDTVPRLPAESATAPASMAMPQRPQDIRQFEQQLQQTLEQTMKARKLPDEP